MQIYFGLLKKFLLAYFFQSIDSITPPLFYKDSHKKEITMKNILYLILIDRLLFIIEYMEIYYNTRIYIGLVGKELYQILSLKYL